jgi:hypothetical protein
VREELRGKPSIAQITSESLTVTLTPQVVSTSGTVTGSINLVSTLARSAVRSPALTRPIRNRRDVSCPGDSFSENAQSPQRVARASACSGGFSRRRWKSSRNGGSSRRCKLKLAPPRHSISAVEMTAKRTRGGSLLPSPRSRGRRTGVEKFFRHHHAVALEK